MPYRLLENEGLPDAIRRIVTEQLDRAMSALVEPGEDLHEGVHEARKRCKKIRAVLRLVRAELGEEYRLENAWYRDAARKLSGARDATAVVEAFATLLERFQGVVDPERFTSIRAALERERNAHRDGALPSRMCEVAALLRRGRCRIAAWPLEREGFDAIAPGLARTYARGRAAWAQVRDDPSTGALHEWRKRVKYHRHHTRLLTWLWRDAMDARRQALRRLSDLLGDDHDLAVLRGKLEEEPRRFGDMPTVQAFLGLLDRRRARLQQETLVWGHRLYPEKPRHLLRRIEGSWKAAQLRQAVRSEIPAALVAPLA